MLQVDPKATGRLIKMIKNMEDRLAEAEMYGWGGTATHLRLTIPQAREKLAAAQRSATKPRSQLVDLNVPVFRGTTPTSQRTGFR